MDPDMPPVPLDVLVGFLHQWLLEFVAWAVTWDWGAFFITVVESVATLNDEDSLDTRELGDSFTELDVLQSLELEHSFDALGRSFDDLGPSFDDVQCSFDEVGCYFDELGHSFD